MVTVNDIIDVQNDKELRFGKPQNATEDMYAIVELKSYFRRRSDTLFVTHSTRKLTKHTHR